EAGLATLLIDLLTAEEEAAEARTRHLRFNIRLLADRLVEATHWLAMEPATANLPVGYFGASTGGGAALVGAAGLPEAVGAGGSGRGRPGLAGEALGRVRAPNPLIGGGDGTVLPDLNRQALEQVATPEKELAVVEGATHLFEEPGALEEVAWL